MSTIAWTWRPPTTSIAARPPTTARRPRRSSRSARRCSPAARSTLVIRTLTQSAHRLDTWLQARLGRPYNVLLGVGLTVEIIRRLTELPQHLREAPRIAWVVALIAMNLALLVHQIGALSHRLPKRARPRRRGRRAPAA